VRAKQLVRVLPRYSYVGGGLYVVWPSQTLVPARVVVVRDFLIAELRKIYQSPADSESALRSQPVARTLGRG
jgi:hypothetical protein